MANSDDRRVHVTIEPAEESGDRVEIVRYVSSGMWWREWGNRRYPVSVKNAAMHAAHDLPYLTWNEGVEGGEEFDALVLELRAQREREAATTEVLAPTSDLQRTIAEDIEIALMVNGGELTHRQVLHIAGGLVTIVEQVRRDALTSAADSFSYAPEAKWTEADVRARLLALAERRGGL